VTTPITYLFLVAAIVAEVVATTALARSESFTRLGPSAITVLGYCLAFYFLSFPLRTMPIGVVYALWSGFGIVFISAIAWLGFGQKLDAPALIGMGLIAAGVIIVNVFSKITFH
jgi:small multidrug resistance pump